MLHAWLVLRISTCYDMHVNTKVLIKFMSQHAAYRESVQIHACYMKHASMLTLQHACLGDTCRLHETCTVHVLYFELDIHEIISPDGSIMLCIPLRDH